MYWSIQQSQAKCANVVLLVLPCWARARIICLLTVFSFPSSPGAVLSVLAGAVTFSIAASTGIFLVLFIVTSESLR